MRGTIIYIHSTCCQEFVSFLEGFPLYRDCPLREGPLYMYTSIVPLVHFQASASVFEPIQVLTVD